VHLDERVTIATPEGVEIEIVLAGLGSRFVARLLDTLVQAAVIFALGVVAVASAGSEWDGVTVAIATVGTFAMFVAYDIVLEAVYGGRTLGKRALGIRVVGLDGEPVGFVQSAVRNLLRVADFLPALYVVGAASIVATRHDQRLGDLAAGTVVMRERFGGRRPTLVAPVTVPVADVQAWDVTAIGAEELAMVRHFLDRRLELPWPVRNYFANEIVGRLAPKVPGAPAGAHPEYVLEGIVVAKQSRGAGA
jgi:uncharacterized RDD family membrane protein YckC